MKNLSFIIINIVVNTSVMGQEHYTVKPTSECIKYIESFGRPLCDVRYFDILPSEAGLVYKLKNNKLVLIPSDLDAIYPGFIFASESDLQSMTKADYFSIDEKYMTVWEIEKRYLDSLPRSVEHFKSFLRSELNYENQIKQLSDFEPYYNLAALKVKEKIPLIEKEKLMISFAITVMDFFVEVEKNNWVFEKRCERYNSYQYSQLHTAIDVVDILNLVFICLERPSDFNFFVKSIDY